jgi:hypothetical protein
MPMPWQLRNAKRRRPRHSEPRPTIELMPAININDLPIPRDYKTYTAPHISLRYPQLSGIRLAAHCVEFHHTGRVQTFRLKWIKTGFGYARPAFICECQRPTIRLYFRYANLACRHCNKALYASQKHDQIGRKRLAACKLRLELGGLPDIREPLPPKPKWNHKKRYQRLRNQVQALEAQANRRFRKQIDIRTFAYHIA